MKITGLLTIVFLSCMLNAQNLNIENDQVRFLICEPSELLSYFDFVTNLVGKPDLESPELLSNKPDSSSISFSQNVLIGDRLLYQVSGTKTHLMNQGSEIQKQNLVYTIIFFSNTINYYLENKTEGMISDNRTIQRMFTDIKSNHSKDTLNSFLLNKLNDKREITIELFRKDLIDYLTEEARFDLFYGDEALKNECLIFTSTQQNLEAFIETSEEIIHENMGKFDDIKNELYEEPELKFKRIFEEEMEKLRNARE